MVTWRGNIFLPPFKVFDSCLISSIKPYVQCGINSNLNVWPGTKWDRLEGPVPSKMDIFTLNYHGNRWWTYNHKLWPSYNVTCWRRCNHCYELGSLMTLLTRELTTQKRGKPTWTYRHTYWKLLTLSNDTWSTWSM